jgi:hypothetical protein
VRSESDQVQHDYVATVEELLIIDSAVASIDAGEMASDEEVQAAFAKFHNAKR